MTSTPWSTGWVVQQPISWSGVTRQFLFWKYTQYRVKMCRYRRGTLVETWKICDRHMIVENAHD